MDINVLGLKAQPAMKLILINILYFILLVPLNAQSFDEVRIYFWPEYISPAFDEAAGNENNARVRSSVTISIKQRAEISILERQLLNQDLPKLKVDVQNFTCQMVIDFISGGSIRHTIAINSFQQVRIDEYPAPYYLATGSVKTFYEKYLSFFRKQCCELPE
jgi:hypothetical protein